MDEKKLLYRRQFLLCRDIIPALSHWKILRLSNGCYLYSHPDLTVTHKRQQGIEIVLLGYVFDSICYRKNNTDILDDIINKSQTFDALIESIKVHAGRFVVIYVNNHTFRLLHDALALREVYYCFIENKIICGSQPNLIAKFSDPPLNITLNESIQRFFGYDLKRVRSGRFWVGNETLYDGIKHLLPNHYLDMIELKAIRYWPRHKLPVRDLDDVVDFSCSFLQGTLKAALFRHELMMAVTGGTDSRTLLAASKKEKDNIYYFVNRHVSLNEKHPDIYIPSAIFKKISVTFHIHDAGGYVDDNFREIFLNNTFMSTDMLLPTIFNIYYKKHSYRLNLQGVGEIGRTFYGAEPRHLNGYYLARALKFKHSLYAVEQCNKWLAEVYPIARMYGVNIMTLLLWEQLLGNWGPVGSSESDIAIENFNPFNSHSLYETMLSVDTKHTKSREQLLFTKMIKKMWPELSEFPFNPPYRGLDHAKILLKYIGIYYPLKSLLYKFGWLRFKLTHGSKNV